MGRRHGVCGLGSPLRALHAGILATAADSSSTRSGRNIFASHFPFEHILLRLKLVDPLTVPTLLAGRYQWGRIPDESWRLARTLTLLSGTAAQMACSWRRFHRWRHFCNLFLALGRSWQHAGFLGSVRPENATITKRIRIVAIAAINDVRPGRFRRVRQRTAQKASQRI